MNTFTTTQRRTIIGYRYHSSRALLNVPDSPDCVMEITEVDEPVSYTVSTGDDDFMAMLEFFMTFFVIVFEQPTQKS
jgi:hypothetical protein